jgi:hypothetical protein
MTIVINLVLSCSPHLLKVCHLMTPHPVPHLPHETQKWAVVTHTAHTTSLSIHTHTHTERTLPLSLYIHTHTHNRVKTTSSQIVLVGFKSLAGPHVLLHILF